MGRAIAPGVGFALRLRRPILVIILKKSDRREYFAMPEPGGDPRQRRG
jgi:hypothetical protein